MFILLATSRCTGRVGTPATSDLDAAIRDAPGRDNYSSIADVETAGTRANDAGTVIDAPAIVDAWTATDAPEPSYCVPQWGVRERTVQVSLDVDAPAVRWVHSGPYSTNVSGIALTPAGLLVRAGVLIGLSPQTGKLIKYYDGFPGYGVGVAGWGEKGALLGYDGLALVDLTIAGERATALWAVHFQGPPIKGEGIHSWEVVVSPEGVAYTGVASGRIVGVDVERGVKLFENHIEEGDEWPSIAMGINGAILVRPGPGAKDHTNRFVDPRTGKVLGKIAAESGVALFSDKSGLLGWSSEDEEPVTIALDNCGRRLWKANNVGWDSPRIVGPEGNIYVGVWAGDANMFLRALSRDGREIGRTSEAKWPLAVGADGIVYALDCFPRRDLYVPPKLYALTSTLSTLWSISLPIKGVANTTIHACPSENAQISKNGLLYLAGPSGPMIDVIAIQTRSPGLADSDWPVRGGGADAHWWANTISP